MSDTRTTNAKSLYRLARDRGETPVFPRLDMRALKTMASRARDAGSYRGARRDRFFGRA